VSNQREIRTGQTRERIMRIIKTRCCNE